MVSYDGGGVMVSYGGVWGYGGRWGLCWGVGVMVCYIVLSAWLPKYICLQLTFVLL